MFFLQISNKSFIICQDTSIQIYNDIFDRISQQHNKPIIRGQSFNCLFLNKTKDLLAITSNQILPFGKDNLTFLYINNSERNKKKSGSFITSSNGISMIESSNRANKKILLAACKKYLKNQKNGILISISLFNSIDDNITSIYFMIQTILKFIVFAKYYQIEIMKVGLNQIIFLLEDLILILGKD